MVVIKRLIYIFLFCKVKRALGVASWHAPCILEKRSQTPFLALPKQHAPMVEISRPAKLLLIITAAGRRKRDYNRGGPPQENRKLLL
jgi:hypothetical protein